MEGSKGGKAPLAFLLLAIASPAAAKPPLCGLVTMGRLEFQRLGGAPDNNLAEVRAHPGVFSGVVLALRWSDLEPSPGRFEFAAIEDGLGRMAQYNAAYPRTPLRAKLRIFQGPSAPEWANALDGGPVQLAERRGENPAGRFWAQQYRAAWHDLQDHLAARYDADPRIAEVAISSCAVSSAEPFILPMRDENIAALHQAGFSDAAYKACLAGAADDYAAWRQTPLDFTFNSFRDTDSGRPRPDPEFAPQLMQDFRARLGPRAVLATHGLVAPIRPQAQPVYQALTALGPPIEFQTVSPTIDLDAAMQTGLAYRPTEIELWDSQAAGGPLAVTAGALAAYARDFTACASAAP